MEQQDPRTENAPETPARVAETGRESPPAETGQAAAVPSSPAGGEERQRNQREPFTGLPEPTADAGDDAIMNRLPRTRPERPNPRRATAAKRKSTTARKTGTRTAGSRAGARSNARARTAAKAPAAKKPATSSRSLPERTLGTAISTARLPFRLTASAARRASGLIRRGNRS